MLESFAVQSDAASEHLVAGLRLERSRVQGITAESAPDDELTALVIAVAQGCQRSFARLHTLTHRRLFGIALRLSNDREDASDVLQETYLKIWLRSGQFDPAKGHPIAWLLGIAQHAAIDGLRHRAAQPKRADTNAIDDEEALQLPSIEPQPLDSLIQTRTGDAVRLSLNALGPDQRESLRLSFYEGLSHGEIADRLGRPLGTVKSWMRRSFSAMRPNLEVHR